MSDRARTVTIDDAHAGQRLDRILADLLPGVSRHRIQKAFTAGAVTVDGRGRPKSFRPGPGALVAIELPPEPTTTAEAEDIPLDIVHEDDHILVIDKPAGLVVHPAPGHAGGTLVNALLHHGRDLADLGDPLRPGIVHRLDRDTSGLIVVARTVAAHAHLAAQLRDRSLGRVYLALSWGQWSQPRGTLHGAIGRHARDRTRMAVVGRGGREAVTHYEVAEDLEFVQLCRVRLDTGRTHQIRVHFQHHGHPVVGDPIYGDDRRARNTAPVDRQAASALVRATPRQFLHAAELRLRHPADDSPRTFTAPLPRDLDGALSSLRLATGRGGDHDGEPGPTDTGH
ncbi:RluA family pseudouridine synthase [bacterium]|nr:RluA family pseudouridine synthase [bacterium]